MSQNLLQQSFTSYKADFGRHYSSVPSTRKSIGVRIKVFCPHVGLRSWSLRIPKTLFEVNRFAKPRRQWDLFIPDLRASLCTVTRICLRHVKGTSLILTSLV
jgi:hypothetical protein